MFLLLRKMAHQLLALAGCMFFMATVPLLAEEEPGQRPLRGAVFGFAPWGMTSEGVAINAARNLHATEFSGVMPEMIQAVAKEIGETINLVPVSYSRMFSMLASGDVDMAFFFQSEESKRISISLVKTHEMRTVIIVSKAQVVTKLEELIFASPRSVLYDPVFDNTAAIKRIYTNDYSHAVRLISKNRVSALIGPEIFLLYSFKQERLDPANFQVVSEVNVNDVYLQFSKASPLLHKMKAVEKAARKYADTGYFKDLVSKYFEIEGLAFYKVTE